MPYTHFQGKSVHHHILEKFTKGAALSSEPYTMDGSSSTLALFDCMTSTAFLLASLFIIFGKFSWQTLILTAFMWAAWSSWRVGWLATARLERLNRLLQEEQHEIETNREEEREELVSLYKLKGLPEPLAQEVSEILMADNERLLEVMLEEELGLSLGDFEHPLIHSAMAFLGALISTLLICAGALTTDHYGAMLGLESAYSYGALAMASGLIAAGSASFSYTQGAKALPSVIYALCFSGFIWMVLSTLIELLPF